MENVKAGRKRKIKNNKFVYRAKKKMKEGRYDLLDAETYEYFLRIGQSMKDMTKQNDDDKGDYCANVLTETKGKEWEVISHAMSSRIIETLIPSCRWADMEGLREVIRDKRSWEGHGCSSHVVEALLKDATRRIEDHSPEELEAVKFVETKSRFFLNNLETQIWETNANHLMRTCLSCCSQTDVERLHEIVKETCLYVMSWGQLNDHFNNPLISGFLQILLAAAKKCVRPTCDKLLKHLRKVALSPKSEVDSETSLPLVFSEEPLLRLLESSVTESSEKMYLKLYEEFFKDHLIAIARSETFFSLLKLISACTDKFLFEEMYTALMDSMEEISETNRNRILVIISDKCVALTTKQGDFIQRLKTLLNCENDVKFSLKLLKMSSASEISELPFDKNGSLILQNIFKFNKPIKIVESFLGLDVDELTLIAEDTKGSWVFNSFLNSATVGEKSRTRLISKLKGSYCRLASSKFGSRVFDDLWKLAKFKEKLQIIGELDRTILSTTPGRVVAKKIQLESYLSDKKSWSSKQGSIKLSE